MKAKSFTISASFPCSPDVVFKAFTGTRQIAAWSGQQGKIQRTIGGKIEFFDGWVKGTVLAYEPGKQVSFTWKPVEWPDESKSSVVSCTFKPSRSGSIFTIKHSGFPNDAERQSHKGGWTEFVFEPLKTYLTA
jgi:uncharacterized protein YndB with AHSA1/START domain